MCGFHVSMQRTFEKKRALKSENITYIFKASLKVFRYAWLLHWNSFLFFFFSLDHLNLYLKALCSVNFLGKDYMIVCLL